MSKAIYDVRDIPESAEIALYGSGSRGKELLCAIREQRADLKVSCFLDSFHGGVCEGLPVVPFGEWRHVGQCLVIITSDFEKQIIGNLTKAGIDDFLIYRAVPAAPASGYSTGPQGAYCPSKGELKEILMWELLDRPVPPPSIVKKITILQYLRRFGISTFVETGTFLGETLNTVKKHVRNAYSIELHPGLHENAREFFRYDHNVHLRFGDSGTEISRILQELDSPALFWLDAHYSGEGTALGTAASPVMKELAAILSHPVQSHVILIDDARCFDNRSFNCTPTDIETLLMKQRPGYQFELKNDIMRFHPRNDAQGWELLLPMDY